MTVLHVRGTLLPTDEPAEFWIRDGLLSTEPVPGAETVFDGGYLTPGLVDAHCHTAIGPDGNLDLAGARAQTIQDRDAGVLLLRDAGEPIDTSSLQDHEDLPRRVRAGRHVARPKRYIRGLGLDLEDPAELPQIVAEQAQAGDGWVKLVGDWIDRETGDLAPLWPDDILKDAIAAAHAHGARVTAHVFGEEALPGLLAADIDCIEHGCGLTDDTIATMVAQDIALVPTLINIVENFPGIADQAAKYPVYAAHMRALHERVDRTIGAAHEAGVRVYAGTDAGGMIRHGRIADEIVSLHRAGLSSADALAAGSWAARNWLGADDLGHGAPADLVCYTEDPGKDLNVLRVPARIVLRGKVVG
ncbi:amidohydrolase family protein [Pseudonocardiaceae bacterium YIM PH 21723]|nr:amidohydrolase family protein [Pseudonocardiaceae bacterium YIM PH 21723]